MTKYIKTGATEFEQFDEIKWNKIYHDCSDPDEWEAKASKLGVDRYHGYFIIPTKEGDMRIYDGDWIATGVNGEHWPVKDEIFQKTYKKLPVIPERVADYIESFSAGETDMDVINVSSAILGAVDYDQSNYIVADWIKEHGDDFARAWLDGYIIEEESNKSGKK